MTDLVFLLLIFFIIMSLTHDDTLPVDLPSGDAPNSQESSPVDVGITENNMYFFQADDNKYTFEEVVPMLDKKIEESGQTNIKISGDKGADYEFVFNLIALSKQRGWTPVLVYN